VLINPNRQGSALPWNERAENMSDFITLLGAEDVGRAGSNMKTAASEMQNAANTLSFEFERMRVFLDDWLSRFETILINNQD
jgi:hypothetical protein